MTTLPPPPPHGTNPNPVVVKESGGCFKVAGIIFAGIIGVTILLFAVIAIAVGSSDTEDPKPSESNGIDVGYGSKDASEDVTELICTNNDALDWAEGELSVTNNSSERSDYGITVVIESPDGSTQIDEGFAFITGLEPGQSTKSDVVFTEPLGDGKCRVTEISRTAA
jgi:hypothetical protein